MLLWIGLGNPGAKYAGNRHNIGFMVMDAIGDDHNFPPYKSQFKGMTRQGLIGGKKIMLLKPMTFMNESGQSVQAAMSFYKIPLENVTVFHDELDLSPGKFRMKTGGGAEHGLRDDICNGAARYSDLLADGNGELFQTRVTEYIKD